MQKYPKAELYSAPAALKRKSALQAQTEYPQQGDVTLPLMCCNKTTFVFLFKAFQPFDLRY